jgi:hypothetical protein
VDTIFATDVPAMHPRLLLAVRLLISRTEAEHSHRLEVIIQEADGDEIARALGPLDALAEEVRNQIPPGRQAGLGMVLNFENLVFPSYGNYQVVIQWDGSEARPPLRLIVSPTPEQ